MNWLSRSAMQWRVPTPVAAALFALPLAAGFALALTRLQEDLFLYIMLEDGPVEWLSFGCFLAASLFAALTARAYLGVGALTLALPFAGVSALMFFIAGEEISWGQRLFGFETPEPLEQVNRQGETTLHNIGSTLEVFRFAMLLIGAYGTIVPLLTLLPRWSHWQEKAFFLVPPLFLMSSFLVLLVWRVARHTIYGYGSGKFRHFEEYTELCLGYALAVFLALIYRRLRMAHTGSVAGQREPVERWLDRSPSAD